MQIKVIFAIIIFFNIFTSSHTLAMQPAIAPHIKRTHSCLENPRVSYASILDELEEAVIESNNEKVEAILAQFHLLPINTKISRLETKSQTRDTPSFTVLETAVIRFTNGTQQDKNLDIIRLLLNAGAKRTSTIRKTLENFPNKKLNSNLN